MNDELEILQQDCHGIHLGWGDMMKGTKNSVEIIGIRTGDLHNTEERQLHRGVR